MSEGRIVISATEASKVLKMNLARVLELLDAGEIPAYREGRSWKIPMTDLHEWASTRAREEAEERKKTKEES